MIFGKSDWRTFKQGIQKEWLLTNGIGGFASSTIIGANTRRYHGMLIASLNPPVKRHLILSKLDESIEINDISYNLSSFQTPGFVMRGYYHLQHVSIDPLPVFTYNVADIFIQKRLGMVHGQNTTVIVYRIINGVKPCKLKLTPLLNFRDYHNNSNRQHMNFKETYEKNTVIVKTPDPEVEIRIFHSDGRFVDIDNCYFTDMQYEKENERGLHSIEDHYIAGYFEIDIKPGEMKNITVITTCENKICTTDGISLIEKEKYRLKSIADKSGYKDEFARILVMASDDFIVNRKSTNSKTIIAGYPWFADWGRDTMISFTGLTLYTKRYNDAKEILYTFAKYVKDGLIPNMFSDEGHKPAYNSVDASLWYFEAVNNYIMHTNDYKFVKKEIFNTLEKIINAYREGTYFNIGMDNDCLIFAGSNETQLTWMDAKVNDWVVTPRHGKAVEINALWYNALKVMEKLSQKFNFEDKLYREISKTVKENFVKKFWDKDNKYLYDCIIGEYKNINLRPNQLLALSLSYPVITEEKAKCVIDSVWRYLYTSYGIRSLSPCSPSYKGKYKGNQFERDSAYHQGTVWAWLMGPFITAVVNSYGYSDHIVSKLDLLFEPLKDHIQRDGCIGTVSEIFDGNEPLNPRGCISQAWSVAEILRTYAEFINKK